MDFLFPIPDRQHLSIFEVRVKAAAASSLGVFGSGVQTEAEMMDSIRSASSEVARMVEDAIRLYGRWVEAGEGNAPQNVIDEAREKAIASSRALESYFRTSN